MLADVNIENDLLTNIWVEDAKAILGEIRTSVVPQLPEHESFEIRFFEVQDDPHLHVEVTRDGPGMIVSGWAGPTVKNGRYTYHRTFVQKTPQEMLRHIRDMLAAPLF